MKRRLGLLAMLLPLFAASLALAQDPPADATPADSAATEAPADSSTEPAADASAPADASTEPAAAEASAGETAPSDPATTEAPADDAAAAEKSADASTDAGTTDAAATDAAATDAGTTDAAIEPAAMDAGTTEAAAEPAATDAAATEAATNAEYNSGDVGGEEGESESAKPSAIAGRPWYISPMFTYTLADEDRGTDDGIGGTLSVGKKVTDGMMLELTGFYSQYGGGDSSATAGSEPTDAKLTGAGLNALVFPMSSLPDAFAVVGLAVGAMKDHPGPIRNYKTTVFDVGVGYLFPISTRFLIRAEARYRMDAHAREKAGTTPNDNKAFYEGAFNLGFVMPLGSVEAPVAEPAEVVPANTGDSDNDGVLDEQDKCPGTPAGAQVNAEGCEADADGDGVPDRIDQCPDTPAGQTVNDVGCPMDSDGDGVPDAQDECPHSPAGAKVLANGCALVGDCRTPRPGEQVDENGCAVEKKFILRGVKFEFDSDRLTPAAMEILNDVAGTLQAYPDIKVELQGHTDNIGTDAYNQGLSERRANSVKTYLAGHNVDAARMSPTGYGESQPIESNDTETGREENRRVELKVLED
ncbi:MAG TPA: OmpA family protein [Solimonas sp.]|nr:OmpA family protein [Solimonas sp.]